MSEGDKLEKNWKPIEGNVKAKSKELYEKVETPLGIINTVIKANSIAQKF